MSEVEAFLDDTPGETRGVIARNGRYDRLLIQRESDPVAARLGSRSVGRVVEVNVGLRAAFVDQGVLPLGFLPLPKGQVITVGQRVEVVVVAEPRDTKGATLRWLGVGQGEPRLMEAGPRVEARLRALAPGVDIQTGLAAIRAGQEAEEDALATHLVLPDLGLDVAVERTRALIAVDIDHVGAAGRKGRDRANLEGLRQAARLIRLKGWGGLVTIDLAGTGHDPQTMAVAARAAFGDDRDIVHGPLNRFGVLQLSLPWRDRPIEAWLVANHPSVRLETTAIALVRQARAGLLSNTAVARYRVRCGEAEAAIVAPLIREMGPRAGLSIDPALSPGRGVVEEA